MKRKRFFLEYELIIGKEKKKINIFIVLSMSFQLQYVIVMYMINIFRNNGLHWSEEADRRTEERKPGFEIWNRFDYEKSST